MMMIHMMVGPLGRLLEQWLPTISLLCLITVKPVSLVRILTESQVMVKNAGDQIQLDCLFHASDYDLFRSPVLWKKSQRGVECQINIMSNINDPFLSTRRYSVEMIQTPPRYRLQLFLSDLSLEDSGNYTCEVRGPQSVAQARVVHSLFVRAPVDHVFISSSRNISEFAPEYKTPSSMNFVEQQAYELRCIATGGYPPPSIDLYIDKISRTNQFHFENKASLHGVRGLQVMSFSTQRWTTSYVPRADENKKELSCVVRVPGLEAYTETVMLHVDYGPRIECQNERAFIGDKNVCLTCVIDAKPLQITYFWVLDNNDTTLSEGEVVDEYWTQDERISNGLLEVQLYLHTTKANSFRNYRLVAENSVSLSTQEVALERRYSSSMGPLTGPIVDGVNRFNKSPPRSQYTSPDFEAYPNGAARPPCSHIRLASLVSLLAILTFITEPRKR